MTDPNLTPNSQREPDGLMPAAREADPGAAAKTKRSMGWAVAIVVVLLAGGFAILHGRGTAGDQGAAVSASARPAAPLQGVGAPWGATAPPHASNPAPRS